MSKVADKFRPPSKTALFEAAKRWNIDAVKTILMAAPALVEASDARGRRALHIACAVNPDTGTLGEANGIKTVAALLEGGAGLEIEVPMDEEEGDFRATPLWYAVARGENLPLVRFLLRHGADASYSLWAAVWRDDDALCRQLLRRTAKAVENLRPSDQGRRRPTHQGSPWPRCRRHRAGTSSTQKIYPSLDEYETASVIPQLQDVRYWPLADIGCCVANVWF
jgi:hypothetical protein